MARNASDPVWEAFCEVVAEEDRDNVLTDMSETAHSDRNSSPSIYIVNRQRMDVINVNVGGILTYKGKEYTYNLEDGNWNGTQLRGFNGVGDDYIEYKPDPRDVQPLARIINDALAPGGNPEFLLKKWDLFRARADVVEELRKYSYDSYFQPGGMIESHYREKFAKWGLEIVSKSIADETRNRLAEASHA